MKTLWCWLCSFFDYFIFFLACQTKTPLHSQLRLYYAENVLFVDFILVWILISPFLYLSSTTLTTTGSISMWMMHLLPLPCISVLTRLQTQMVIRYAVLLRSLFLNQIICTVFLHLSVLCHTVFVSSRWRCISTPAVHHPSCSLTWSLNTWSTWRWAGGNYKLCVNNPDVTVYESVAHTVSLWSCDTSPDQSTQTTTLNIITWCMFLCCFPLVTRKYSLWWRQNFEFVSFSPDVFLLFRQKARVDCC